MGRIASFQRTRTGHVALQNTPHRLSALTLASPTLKRPERRILNAGARKTMVDCKAARARKGTPAASACGGSAVARESWCEHEKEDTLARRASRVTQRVPLFSRERDTRASRGSAARVCVLSVRVEGDDLGVRDFDEVALGRVREEEEERVAFQFCVSTVRFRSDLDF